MLFTRQNPVCKMYLPTVRCTRVGAHCTCDVSHFPVLCVLQLLAVLLLFDTAFRGALDIAQGNNVSLTRQSLVENWTRFPNP